MEYLSGKMTTMRLINMGLTGIDRYWKRLSATGVWVRLTKKGPQT